MKIKKISENIFEIEKEGKMNVPALVFASDALMEKIKLDKTLEQAKNVAQLPGIVEKSLTMPDAHQGYGFPIGGVAAFDLKKGIISPGGVGYDINCLTGDTKILTEFGNTIKIEDFEKYKSEIEIEQNGQKIKQIKFSRNLPTLNFKEKRIEDKRINLFMSKDSEEVYEITLESGLKIKATKDHPFLTKNEMKKLLDLKEKEELAVNTFEGIESEEKIDEKEAIIAKLIGYMFGDGTFYESKGNLRAIVYGQKEDLEEIKIDLLRLGIKSSIFSRTREHIIKTRYKENKFEATNWELHIYNQNFLKFLKEKGLALGNKTRQEIRVPEWIRNSGKIIKRLFLAGFFGAEMSSPKALSKTCFYAPTINQNKITVLKQNCRDFLIDLGLILEEFNIKNYSISEMDDHFNKYNEKTSRLRLMIFGEDNIIKLWRYIGFEYNKKRQVLGNIASLYILQKCQENKKRIELAKKIKEYKSKGLKLKEVQRILEEQINSRFIERHYYENAKQRINLDFISFNEFKDQKLKEISEFGAIFNKIKEIKRIPGSYKVYDFNIQDNHNFIANSFIVSNCGVRLLTTNIKKSDFLAKRDQILSELYKNVPSGVGVESEFKLTDQQIDEVLEKGSRWALENRYATKEDIQKTEDSGCIEGADPKKVSQKAKARGRKQLGTLGAGNHFLEVQEIDTIHDEKIAKVFNLNKNNVTIMIHTGSRGLGHQTASDYIQKMEKVYGFKDLPDRELIFAPIESDLGKDYRAAMAAAANFAFANRQLITYQIRKSFKKFFPKSKIEVVYDIAHNIAKFEELTINNKKQTLCIHRKGATRSFGPGRKEIPEIYRKIGCPIFIPGSMGTYSYVLIGTKKAEEISLASTAHGAGRLLSRTYAKNNLSTEQIKKDLKSKDIVIKTGSEKGLLEEAPEAYKDVNEVVRVSHELGIGNLVVRLKPLAVMKG